jgi:hypothetical protein
MSLRQLAAVVVTVGIVVVIALGAALLLVPVPAVQGAAVGALAGIATSIVAGTATLLLARHLRRTGEIRQRTDASSWMFANSGVDVESRVFSIRLLNERDIGTALWDLQVVFYKDGKPWFYEPPLERQTSSPVDVVDLPPYKTVTQVFSIVFYKGGDAFRKAGESDKIKLVADLPDGGVFEADLPRWNAPDIASA